MSIVPPVIPSPLPDILHTFKPQLANTGTIIKVTLSPTPPVECLSTTIPLYLDKSKVSPLLIKTSVKLIVSSSLIPFIAIAISILAI